MRSRVLQQLSAIFESEGFARSARRKAILTYLTERALADPTADISAAAIAAAVYNRTDDDPERDTVVRVEMTRVRSALDAWYAGPGANSPVRINIPKGSYLPVFEVAHPPEPQPSPDPIPQPPPRRTFPRWALFAATLLIPLAALVWSAIPRHARPSSPETAAVETLLWLPGAMRQPSLSPDRRSIAFVWDGERGRPDIFTNRLGTQSVDRLTDGPEPNVSPAWSPDGATIAFQRRTGAADRAIYLIPSNSTPNPIPRLLTTIHTAVAGLAWTPDSKHLIVPDSPNGAPLGLYLVSIASGQRQPLTEGLNAFHPAVSPDGRTLAFLADREHNPRVGLYLLPLDAQFHPAGPARLLPNTLIPGAVVPTWSLDGQWIYYGVPGGIAMRCSSSTGQVERLTSFPSRIAPPIEIAPGQFLSMRNRRQLFLARVTPAAGARPTAAFESLAQDTYPDLAPNGRRVVFSSTRDNQPGLWFADPDGRNTTHIATASAPSYPRWSPDSSQVAFSLNLPDGHIRLFLATPNGPSQPIPLTPGDYRFPSFSHNGRYLYFDSNRDGAWRIWRLPLPLTNPLPEPEPLTPAPSGFAAESPDGRHLYYVSPQQQQVLRLDLATRSTTPIGQFPLPALLRATADGLYIEVNTGIRDPEVWFHPFHPHQPRRIYTPGTPVIGWSPTPDPKTLLMGLSRTQSELQTFTR